MYVIGVDMLDIKLATLLTVAKEKNFTKAAEKLSLTQPAVSHHIGQLDEHPDIYTRQKRSATDFRG